MYANPDFIIFVWQHTFLEQSNCYLKSICKPKNEIKQNKTNDNKNNPPPQKININKKQNNNNNN